MQQYMYPGLCIMFFCVVQAMARNGIYRGHTLCVACAAVWRLSGCVCSGRMRRLHSLYIVSLICIAVTCKHRHV